MDGEKENYPDPKGHSKMPFRQLQTNKMFIDREKNTNCTENKKNPADE